MSINEWLILLVLSFIWGGSFYFIEIAVTELTPLVLVFLRVSIAAVALWIFILIKGLAVPKRGSHWLAFFIMGLLNNVIPFTLIAWGQIYIASGLASIFNATTPLFVVIVAGVFLADERPNGLKIMGVIIGFAGVVIMVGSSAIQGLSSNVLAQLAILAAALSYSFAAVYGRRFTTMNLHPIVVAAGQVSVSASILFVVLIFMGPPVDTLMPSAQALSAVFALAILCTAVAYTLAFKLLASAGATNLSLVTFLIPVTAILLGFLLLDESLELEHFVGMLMIAIGLSAIDGRIWKSFFPTSATGQ